jgi:hypothetical protein
MNEEKFNRLVSTAKRLVDEELAYTLIMKSRIGIMMSVNY